MVDHGNKHKKGTSRVTPHKDVFEIDAIFKEDSDEARSPMGKSTSTIKKKRGKRGSSTIKRTSKLKMENESLKQAMSQIQAQY